MMMNDKIEVVAIGDEVLSGIAVNTNAAFISYELLKAGFKVHGHRVVPDERVALKKGLQEALEQNGIVICTGGLGPTCDDITRKVVSELFDCECLYRPELEEALMKRYEKMIPEMKIRYQDVIKTFRDQATVPSKAETLPNPNGTASGFFLKKDQSLLFLMPGVPSEMKPMFLQHVLPQILQHLSTQKRQIGTFLHLCELPESSVDPLLRELREKNKALDFGIYPSLGTLSIHVKTTEKDEQKGLKLVHEALDQLRKAFEWHVFESPSGKIEEAVHLALINKKLTLSMAESCTGGALAAALTRYPGASAYFLGSIVAYSNEVKTKVLGVPQEIIQAKGAVSPEVAREMLQGAFNVTGSDYAMAVTGIAGPTGGTPEKPVGTVWGAVGRRGQEPKVWKIPTHGHREMIITRSVSALLSQLWRGLV